MVQGLGLRSFYLIMRARFLRAVGVGLSPKPKTLNPKP